MRLNLLFSVRSIQAMPVGFGPTLPTFCRVVSFCRSSDSVPFTWYDGVVSRNITLVLCTVVVTREQ